MFLKRCVLASVVELHRGGSATNGATTCSLPTSRVLAVAMAQEFRWGEEGDDDIKLAIYWIAFQKHIWKHSMIA